jgi:predicted transcriptional regulator
MKSGAWAKQDPEKNYFKLPNEIYSLGLSAGEIAVYGYLLSIEDRKTYQCYPSYKKIGKAVGMSENTVKKYVSMLEDRELILTEPTSVITKDGRKQNGSLLYTILPIHIAVDNFNRKQLQYLELESQRQQMAEYLS